MVKRGLGILLIAFGLIFACVYGISSVNASIYFSNIQPAYSLGDVVNIEVGVSPVQSEYLLSTELICGGISVVNFNSMPDANGKAVIRIPLTYNTLGSSLGGCFFRSSYANEYQNSRSFEITKKLDIILDVSSFFIKPGDEITISGLATRVDGSAVDGVVEVTIPIFVVKNNNLSVPVSLNDSNNTVNRSQILYQNLESKNEVFSGNVVGGNFSVTRKFASDIPAGDYKIAVDVYENSLSGKKTNEGAEYGDLKVDQVPTKIDTVLNSEIFDPGQNLSFKSILIDQAGFNIDDDIANIISLNSTKVFEKVAKSGEVLDYSIPTDQTSGYYTIDSSNTYIKSQKTFFVKEKALALFEIVNGSLIIRNIGNVAYNKDIEVSFTDENGKVMSFIKHIDLGLGQSKEFKLTGLNQQYSIKVGDGESQMISPGVMLTGNAIGVGDAANTGRLIMSQPIVWIFLLLIILAIILFVYRDYFRKKSVAKPFGKNKVSSSSSSSSSKGIILLKGSGNASEKPKPLKFEGDKNKKDLSKNPFISKPVDNIHRRDFRTIGQNDKGLDMISVTKPKIDENKRVVVGPEVRKEEGIKRFYSAATATPTQAEQALVSDGQKSVSTMLLLKIKSPLTKIAKENLEKSIAVVYEKKAAVFESGDFIYAVFSPLVTKTFKNEITAARCAEKIVADLKDYNIKFKEKIRFGIGINTGEIINKIEDKKLKFTALGTLLPIAKRLADAADGSILLAKPAYEKAMAEIKANKVNINGTDAYEIKQIVDYDKNKKFIEDFMKREGRDISRR
jgi:hypothetical protein